MILKKIYSQVQYGGKDGNRIFNETLQGKQKTRITA